MSSITHSDYALPFLPWLPWVARHRQDNFYLCHFTQNGQGMCGRHFCGDKLPTISPTNFAYVG